MVLRARKSWIQKQLAEKIGASQRTVVAWESGASIPRKTTQVNIAKVFGLSEDYFFNVENNVPDERKEFSDNLSLKELKK
ncbi:helix-turn-helix domain-containing protein [Anaeromassilibacillus sp. An172]|uniref:helix-turn-helix transcriptional regulator n=1 Tax=Anaeromassilibacillus sp. An172 TaxID=1965570 RepID=UPI0013029EC6